MCGIAGFWSCDSISRPDAEHILAGMAETIRHRGPDDSGTWFDDEIGVALCHQRLSIIDLSRAGHQPMLSACGRFVISYNGEIYNFQKIRAELAQLGHRFRSNSDTEVILEAAVEWGFEGMLSKLVGMFAFALFDRKERMLYLVRDRLGKKPLYFYLTGKLLIFGSELKALCAYPGFPRKIDNGSLELYLRYQYVPAPNTIYSDTRKLLPGQYCSISLDTGGKLLDPNFYTYWDALLVAGDGQSNLIQDDDTAVIRMFQDLLLDATGKRMISDVPLGALLSGGIDSSLVTALMQSLSNKPVRTFTIGFHEADFDEAQQAKAIAAHLGTDHTELYVTSRETMDVVPALPDIYDEPFADSSQIPTFVVSKLARQQVTVALSGDGGDELFGGYNRYVWANKIWKSVAWLPADLRRGISNGLTGRTPETWDKMFKPVMHLAPAALRQRMIGDKLHKLAAIIKARDSDDVYRTLVWSGEQNCSILSPNRKTDMAIPDPLERLGDILPFKDAILRMMLTDQMTYLPDDILVKVDRASMAVALELRAPLLDHRVAELAWRLPQKYKIRDGRSKWLLRRILDKYVPAKLIDRPKSGFGIPFGQWLRDPLREWAEELLDEKKLQQEGIFQAEAVRLYWQEHLAGRRNRQYILWPILMFQAWKNRWKADYFDATAQR
jgi:asparagine synthase (glutamine-hydrolysing)